MLDSLKTKKLALAKELSEKKLRVRIVLNCEQSAQKG